MSFLSSCSTSSHPAGAGIAEAVRTLADHELVGALDGPAGAALEIPLARLLLVPRHGGLTGVDAGVLEFGPLFQGLGSELRAFSSFSPGRSSFKSSQLTSASSFLPYLHSGCPRASPAPAPPSSLLGIMMLRFRKVNTEGPRACSAQPSPWKRSPPGPSATP